MDRIHKLELSAILDKLTDQDNDIFLYKRKLANYFVLKNLDWEGVDIQKQLKEIVKSQYASKSRGIRTYNRVISKVDVMINEIKERKLLTGGAGGPHSIMMYGIGSENKTANKEKSVKVAKDLELFKTFSFKHENYHLGSTSVDGTLPVTQALLQNIKFAYCAALEVNASFVLYYSGHADKDGDWSFYDNYIVLDDVVSALHDVLKISGTWNPTPVFIICDCCHAGKWTQELKSMHDDQENKVNVSFISVVAACGQVENARASKFSLMMFAGSDEASIKDYIAEYKPSINKGGSECRPLEVRDLMSTRTLWFRNTLFNEADVPPALNVIPPVGKDDIEVDA